MAEKKRFRPTLGQYRELQDTIVDLEKQLDIARMECKALQEKLDKAHMDYNCLSDNFDNLSRVADANLKELEEMKNAYSELKHRGFFARLLNK